MDQVEEHFLGALRDSAPAPGATTVGDVAHAALLEPLFEAQARSRLLDLAARSLQQRGEGFYTIGSAGHESNAALGLLSRVSDPALLHYRSGAFYTARALLAGAVDPVLETLRSLTCSAADPMSGGRHKVIGHPALDIVPQTSTIASQLPRAVGLAFSLGLARVLARETPWPTDAVVICSFGDASLNHSTATGALNAAAYLSHRRKACPVLFVCEDNGIGISTRTPAGWVESALQRTGFPVFRADGHEPLELLAVTQQALASVRERRSPAVLHLRTVRLMGHAGSDVEIAYRSARSIAADLRLDPLLATAQALVASGREPGELVDSYEELRREVDDAAQRVSQEPRLSTREAVMRPLAFRHPAWPTIRSIPPHDPAGGGRSLTLAQAVTTTLADQLAVDPGVLVFGEDVAVKGGVYGVTRGLFDRFGPARVFDTLLDEQTILGTALGAALAGFVPVPEIQYLAYLHNAEDQLRGEAASLRFFSDGQYRNGMVVRVAGLAYQRGFGGHFHNDNSVAVLRDIPGLVLAVPSHPALAPGLLRGCLELARHDGRVCVFLEPIARYHTRDLVEGDQQWTAEYDDRHVFELGDIAVHGTGRQLVLVSFGNGVHLSRSAAVALADEGVDCAVVDLMWLAPLPTEALAQVARSASAVLVVDETRASGGVGEAVVTALVEAGVTAPTARVTSADSFVPLGPAAATVLLQESVVVAAGRRLVEESARRPRVTR